ncbi:MerR family redox-sensitive transcriptional activator SoxR [Inhella inkyongensis]|uniref:MerR family redox-sensitive transcriptional activator SoxR n=1 Tax=Inhella inkyongensis TaxID=392593 RepID=A0A840S923_9BURK|nr:redox-sensitive transcriptional activator SoxR [Inhella inkyongensis]MBB5206143.1 MerR family redox-sensitive transcriptional activator SoxR [Inhella inkyongensis]
MEESWMPIGELARRAGLASSALRYYEKEGLIDGGRRQSSGHRHYPRHVLRRLAFIRAAQQVGLTLPEIRGLLATLPEARTPTKADWERLSRQWLPLLEARIRALQTLHDKLTGCIGCGCLSLKACALYNPADQAAGKGAGARYLLGDRPE